MAVMNPSTPTNYKKEKHGKLLFNNIYLWRSAADPREVAFSYTTPNSLFNM